MTCQSSGPSPEFWSKYCEIGLPRGAATWHPAESNRAGSSRSGTTRGTWLAACWRTTRPRLERLRVPTDTGFARVRAPYVDYPGIDVNGSRFVAYRTEGK